MSGGVVRLVASRAADEALWLTERRKGFTGTDANRCLTPSGRRAIIREKVTGERSDLSRIPAIAWGKARERAIMNWVEGKFGIPANDFLVAGDNPRHLATSDGLLLHRDGTPSMGCEVKTSVKEIDPGEYQAQIQWNMHVTGLDEWLLVWEQNDGGAPPKPVGEPVWAWIERDQALIDILAGEADAILAEADASSPEDTEPLILDEDDEIAYLAGEVLAGREVEAEGKARREAAWAKLLALLGDRPDAQWRSDAAQVTWSTSPGRPTLVVDREAMEKKAPAVVKKYRDLEARFTAEAPGKESRRLTITRKDA